MRERGGLLLCAGLALLFVSVAADADLLRCKGPDGKMIYTNDKALCPQAKPFEPEGEVQSGGPPAVSKPAESTPGVTPEDAALAERKQRSEARQRAAEEEESRAQAWRDKKTQRETALAKIQKRRAYLETFFALCNVGGTVVARDAAGVERNVRCTDIRSQYAALGKDEERARQQLEALPDECRRAGCLPGWIR